MIRVTTRCLQCRSGSGRQPNPRLVDGASVIWGYIDLIGRKGIRKSCFVDEPISIYSHSDWSEQKRLDAGDMRTVVIHKAGGPEVPRIEERPCRQATLGPLGWRVSGDRLQSAKANGEEFLYACPTLFVLFNNCEALHLFRA